MQVSQDNHYKRTKFVYVRENRESKVDPGTYAYIKKAETAYYLIIVINN